MWMRDFRLEVNVGNRPTQVFHKLRMDFRYQEILRVNEKYNMADTFELDIYNLGVDSFNTLNSKEEVLIKFYTGYLDNDKLDLVFEGKVINVVGRRSIPEYITTLFCIPKGLGKAIKTCSFQGKREDTLEDVLDSMARILKLKPNYMGLEDVLDIPYRAKTIEGVGIEEINKIGNQFYFAPRVEGDELRYITLPESGSASKIKITHTLKAELIRGIPKASVAMINIPYAFNTRIKTGELIDTSKLIGKDNKGSSITGGIGNPNGIADVAGLGKGSLHYSDTLYKWAIQQKYQIQFANHSGSNYTDQYISNYECAVYTGNKKGQ